MFSHLPKIMAATLVAVPLFFGYAHAAGGVSTAATRVTHWEMELALIRTDIVWGDSTATDVDDAYCHGVGPHLNRPARYARFDCLVHGYTSAPGCDTADLTDEVVFEWWLANCGVDDDFEAVVSWNHGNWVLRRLGDS